MTFSNKNDDFLKVNYHKVSNKKDNKFVGLKINANNIDFYYPEAYHLNTNLPIGKNTNDILKILNTISLAKSNINTSDTQVISSYSPNNSLPLISFVWIIKDYMVNGFYINREVKYKTNQNGRIDWKRTINGQAFISNGNLIFKDIVVRVNDKSDNIIVDIHKYCIKKALSLLGWLFNINNHEFIDSTPYYPGLNGLYKNILRNELLQTFDDQKKLRLRHMLTIIEGLGDSETTDQIVYGVSNYNYVFEQIIDSIFGNEDPAKYYPTGLWYLKNSDSNPYITSPMRPDTILDFNNNIYIIDAKLYRYGYTSDKKHLPTARDILKQVAYGEEVSRNKPNDNYNVRNAFILPYDKENNKFNKSENIEYIGYARLNSSSGNEDYEYIHSFLIDLKYAVTTWNEINHDHDIEKLVNIIEREHKELITNRNQKKYI